MNSDTNNYDLIALIESALKEDQEVKDKRDDSSWLSKAKKDGYHKAPSKKTKKSLKSDSKDSKDEDFDIIEDEENDEEDNRELDEEKPEPTTINLNDAVIYEKFIDDLNMFRAAHSFSDKDIGRELRLYFDSLTKEEKQALHVLIKGLIHVTLMDVKGKSAKTPSDFSLSIKKTGATSKEKNRSLDKKIELEKSGKKVDNNTPIASPIKIGEAHQNKSEILKVISLNKLIWLRLIILSK